MTEDEKWMQLACEQAKLAYGKTSPNPLVGAVAVKNNELLSKGYHHKAGLAHAEVDCLKNDIDFTGATLYVTLEPCSTFGRTPPCTQKIIDKKIKRVVIGSLDPNPQHAGSAIEILQNNGIEVSTNILQQQCWEMNLPFFKWVTEKRPYVILKMAMTLDGKIATKDGISKWITGPNARNEVQKLRKWCDAIMVGGETVLKDDSGLKVNSPHWQQPQRYVWTSKTKLATDLKIFEDDGAKAKLCKPTNHDQWQLFLRELGEDNKTSLLIEGGGELAANALQAGAVDEIQFFIAPKILGGKESRAVVGGISPLSLDDSIKIQDWQYSSIGDDLLIKGYLNNFWKAK